MTEPQSTRISETKLEFPYSRTLGPVHGAFFQALRNGELLGIRTTFGTVVPPVEYDPTTGAALTPDQLTKVGPGGTVESWTWVQEPTPKHPLDKPFAFALIKPDQADTTIASAVDASEDQLHTGMRVTARFKTEPDGRITDLEAWIPA